MILFLKYISYKNPFRKNIVPNLSVGTYIFDIFDYYFTKHSSRKSLRGFQRNLKMCNICVTYQYVITYNKEPALPLNSMGFGSF